MINGTWNIFTSKNTLNSSKDLRIIRDDVVRNNKVLMKYIADFISKVLEQINRNSSMNNKCIIQNK